LIEDESESPNTNTVIKTSTNKENNLLDFSLDVSESVEDQNKEEESLLDMMQKTSNKKVKKRRKKRKGVSKSHKKQVFRSKELVNPIKVEEPLEVLKK